MLWPETGSVPGKFTVTQTDVSSTDTVVSYSVLSSSTATNGGGDYATLSGTVTIPAGSTQADIDVTGIVDDNIVEADETVTLQLDSISSSNPGITLVGTPVKMEADTVTGVDETFQTVSFQQTYDTPPQSSCCWAKRTPAHPFSASRT